jgi:hypothetical protein
MTGFDARYASGRMLETYPTQLEEKGVYEYPIRIDASAYPVTIRWNTIKSAGRSLVLTSPDGKLGNVVMSGSGAIQLKDASLRTVVVTLKNSETPTTWGLGQNYPNPFNPLTVIRFSLMVNSYVTLKVYNVLGQEVKTLVDGMRDAGYESVEWDGRDAQGLSVPTGIYFVRMTAGDFSAAQKVMLMK